MMDVNHIECMAQRFGKPKTMASSEKMVPKNFDDDS
jgi:hypothetical protein